MDAGTPALSFALQLRQRLFAGGARRDPSGLRWGQPETLILEGKSTNSDSI